MATDDYREPWNVTRGARYTFRASVHIQVRAINVQNLQMQALCEFKWKLVGGKWTCYHYFAIRGLDTRLRLGETYTKVGGKGA